MEILNDLLGYLPPLKPMLRLFMGLSVGLFMASVMEAMGLIKPLARLTRPLVKHAHLGDVSGAAFATAFLSPMSATALLGEALEQNKMSKKEVVISNLFNSLPTTLTHFPSLFFISVPLLGLPAVIYTSLSLFAAFFRTLVIIAVGHVILPPCEQRNCQTLSEKQEPKISAFRKGLQRFYKRIPRLLFISIPVYCVIYYMQLFDVFSYTETWFTETLGVNTLKPEALSIILLYMVGEMHAAIASATLIMSSASLTPHDLVLALLIGNILSTPMRGIRHQLPAYAGYFPINFAILLVCINQAWRMLSMVIITMIYYLIFF